MKKRIHSLIEKYKSLPTPLRASFFFVFCGVFKDVVDVISTPIFTRILTTEEYGLFNVYNSWYQIFRIIITLNLFSETFNVGLARFGEDKDRFASSQLGLITTMFVFWSAVYLLLRTTLNERIGLDSRFIMLMLFQVLFTSSFYIWFQKNRYIYNYKTVTAVTLIYTVLQPLLGILFIRLNRFGLNNGELRIYAGVGVQITFGLVFFIAQLISNRTFMTRRYWLFALKLNIPLLPHYFSQILLNHSDKLMIDAFQGKSYTAIYSVAHAAAFVIQAVTSNLNSSLVPWFYENLKKRTYKGIKKVTSSLILLVSLVVVMLVLVAPEAMKVLASSKYHDGIWIIPPLAFSVYLIFVYVLFSDLELFYERSTFILISSIVGAASNILLNYIFIPRIGYLAAGYTTVVGYVLMCIGHAVFAGITCRKNGIPFSQLYDLRLILLVTGSLAAVCFLIMKLYSFILLRYALLLGILAGLFLKRNTIIGLIKHKTE